MVIHLIKPIYNIELDTKQIKIEGFIDEKQTKYESVEELLNSIEANSKLYCYMYQPVVAYFEEWAVKHNIRIPAVTDCSYYSGHSYNINTFAPIHIMGSSHESVPRTTSVKIFYNGFEIRLLDVSLWMDRLNMWEIAENDHWSLFEVLNCLEDIIERDYVPYIEQNRSGKVPSTLASLSRSLIQPKFKLKNISRNTFLREIKSAYNSGYNYIASTKTYEHLYYYDTKSMYPFVLTHYVYPNPKFVPEKFEGFRRSKLAMYHIRRIKASLKPNHFPTIFCQQEQQIRMGLSDNININWTFHGGLEGWITSVDYAMLYRDYIVHELDIDETFVYTNTCNGSYLFGESITKYFNLKETSSGVQRQAYKLILNTFSGSLGMQLRHKYRVDSLNDPHIKRYLKKSNDGGLSPWDISAFMTAYARRYITDIALEAGYDNVVCISTDAVVVKNAEPILKYVGNELGNLNLEKEMFNAHWWRPCAYEWQDESGTWHGKANGLPTYKYEHGKTLYEIPKIIYDTKLHIYKKEVQKYSIEFDDYEEEETYEE